MLSPSRLLVIAASALLLGGCLASDIPFQKLEAKYASASSRFMDLPGGLRVHYRDQGRRDAPAVVLVHGFAASLHTWEPWVQRLQADYRVISLDLPGHGLTRAPSGYRTSGDGNVGVVDQVTRSLGAERFVLVGNSMGGGVAWNYALVHPERTRGLVLVNAAGFPSQSRSENAPVVFKLLGNPVGRAVLRKVDPRPLASGGLKKAYQDESLVTPALVDRYVELARAPGHREMLTSQRPGPARPVTPATFAQIKAPTLVMVGTKDQVIPAASSRAFVRAIPKAVLVEYPDGGHVPMEQMPDQSAADLRKFLAGLPPG